MWKREISCVEGYTGIPMVVKVLIQKRYIRGLIKTKYLWDLPQKIVWQFNNDRIASIYTMNALNKSSELWHTSVNRKARPVVEGEHDKRWNDHGWYILMIMQCRICRFRIQDSLFDLMNLLLVSHFWNILVLKYIH